jgi:RHS repeat-associated protein
LTYSRQSGLPDGYAYIATAYDEYGRVIASGFQNAKSSSLEPKLQDFTANTNLLSRTVYGKGDELLYLDKVTRQELWNMEEDLPTGKPIVTTSDYDDFGRVVINQSNHLFGDGNRNDTYRFIYSPTGQVLSTTHTVITPGATYTSISTLEEDHAGRPAIDRHQLNKDNLIGQNVTIAQYTYTEKDALSIERIGSGLQTTNYDYFSNGFLKSINDPEDQKDDLYALELSYQDRLNSPTSRKSNGKINSIQHFASKAGGYRQTFGYDGLDRLEVVECNVPNNGRNQDYSTNYSYDKRGNLKTLNRMGQRESGAYGSIDQLSYIILNGTNRIERISESVVSADYRAGFHTQGSGIEYQYDDNGNVTFDPSRKLTVKYNYLNLPHTFTFDNGKEIRIVYNSAGKKLVETTVSNDTAQSRHYLGDMEFMNSQLTHVHHSKGRVIVAGAEVSPPTDDCDITDVPEVPDFPDDPFAPERVKTPNSTELGGSLSRDAEFDQQVANLSYLGKHSGFLSEGRTIYKGSETSTTAKLPTTNAIAFTGQKIVKLEAGFSAPIGTAMMAIAQECNVAVTWQYEYYLKDHLGNVRTRFADLNKNGEISDDEILGEHHYYAFGLEMQGHWNDGNSTDRYRYNGIERNEELGLDLAVFRSYDPAIGRWLQVDPKA